jgi:hypothetical protein
MVWSHALRGAGGRLLAARRPLLRSSPRHNPAGCGSARDGGGTGGGGAGAKRATEQQQLKPVSKESKLAAKVCCWICKRPFTTADPDDDTACARQDCSMHPGGGERGGRGGGGAGNLMG